MSKLIKRKNKLTMNSIESYRSEFGTDSQLELLNKCNRLWDNLSYFREKRARANRFVYGDQWGDMVEVRGETMTMREWVSRQGNTALQANLLAKMVNTVAGVLVKEQNEPYCYARNPNKQSVGELFTVSLQENWQRNKMTRLNTINVKEALISGACFAREDYGFRNGTNDAWTDICNPNYIFFDSGMKDPRFWDMTLIGEIHDVSFNELVSKFVKSRKDYEKLYDLYMAQSNNFSDDSIDITDVHNNSYTTFYTPRDSSMCRVFEVWTKEVRPRYLCHDPNDGTIYYVDIKDKDMLAQIESTNMERVSIGMSEGWSEDEIPIITKEFFMNEYWYYRFITPQGYVICEGESPYENGMHPYTMLATPFIDGKIVSYIADAIDQNMAINRILTLDDWIRRTNAKGVTMVPKQLVPDDMTFDEFAEQWTSIDGIIYYEPKPGIPEPKQFFGATTTLNTTQMVSMFSELMESTLAVSGALQGKTPYSGTSAALYAQQTQNSSTPLAAFLSDYRLYMEDIARKKLSIMIQNYPQERFEAIVGTRPDMFESIDISSIYDVETYISIKSSTETPVATMIANDSLKELADRGFLTGRDYVELSNIPYKDKIIQRMDAREQQANEIKQQQAEQQSEQPVM